MRGRVLLFNAVVFGTAFCINENHADYFVAQNGQAPDFPYASWSTAASNIQEAVDAATNNAVVWVGAGTYQCGPAATNFNGTNVVYINKSLVLRGAGGTANTIINGGGSNRCICVNLAAGQIVIIDGFTITNGYNFNRGGGLYLLGSGASTVVVQNCVISGNIVRYDVDETYRGGGGLFCYSTVVAPLISNCVIRGNQAIAGAISATNHGGGLWLRAPATVVDCQIANNTAGNNGGGLYLWTTKTTVNRCIIANNAAGYSGGGIYVQGNALALYNSLVASNTVAAGSGLFLYNLTEIAIHNNTIVSNALQTGNSVSGADFRNNIIGQLILNASTVITGYNNCLPSAPTIGTWFNTIITNTAGIRFENAAGDFHLRNDSPCVNAGLYMDWMDGALDLGKHRRLDKIRRAPDIGCYEYLPRGALLHLQ